jgi:quinol monooxygenase YgiN
MAYVVTAYWTARDGEERAVADALGKLIEPSRAEPGNLEYQIHRDPSDSRLFFLYEQYVDEEAYQAHQQSAHFKQFGVQEGFPRLERRERAFYVTWDGSESGGGSNDGD